MSTTSKYPHFSSRRRVFERLSGRSPKNNTKRKAALSTRTSMAIKCPPADYYPYRFFMETDLAIAAGEFKCP